MFLPLKDINPTERTPYVTYTFIAINVLVFFYQRFVDPSLVLSLGAIPREITRMTDLVETQYFGGYAMRHLPGPKPIFLTLFTSMFMHGGFFHLGGNMLYLWIFGNNVEDILGPVKFVIFYLASGLVAHALHIASNPSSIIPTVGASGAIAGLLGAYLIAFPRARVLTLMFLFYFIRLTVIPASVIIIYWFVLQLIMGFMSLGGSAGGGVAWFAHIGGFIGGIILIYAMAGNTVYWLRRGGYND